MNAHLAKLVHGCTSKDGVLESVDMSWNGKDVGVYLCTEGEVYIGVTSMLEMLGVDDFMKTIIYGNKCKDRVSYCGTWDPVVYYSELRELILTDPVLSKLPSVETFDWDGFQRALYAASRSIVVEQVETLGEKIKSLSGIKRRLEANLEETPKEGIVEPVPKKPRLPPQSNESDESE
jgi:hypothetical protein